MPIQYEYGFSYEGFKHWHFYPLCHNTVLTQRRRKSIINFIITRSEHFFPKPRDLARQKMQVQDFIYRLTISPNFKFLAVVVLEFLYVQEKFLTKRKKNNKKNGQILELKLHSQALLNSKILFTPN